MPGIRMSSRTQPTSRGPAFEELARRSVGRHRPPLGRKQPHEAFAHGRVIVDDVHVGPAAAGRIERSHVAIFAGAPASSRTPSLASSWTSNGR